MNPELLIKAIVVYSTIALFTLLVAGVDSMPNEAFFPILGILFILIYMWYNYISEDDLDSILKFKFLRKR